MSNYTARNAHIAPTESQITVSGVALTQGQSMTVRVALQHFALSLTEDGLGADPHGVEMTKQYLDRVSEINDLIRRTCT